MDTNEFDLWLEIEDSLRIREFFEPDVDYDDFLNNTELFTVEIYVRNHDEVVGYLICTVFYDDIIEDNGGNLVTVADDYTTQDTYEAMEVIQKRMEQHTEKQHDLYLFFPEPSTIYIRNIAVKDDYRCKGIGNWLLRNLSQIIVNRYRRDPVTIIIKIFPEDIDWTKTPPQFMKFESDTKEIDVTTSFWSNEIDVYDETDPMFIKMKRLLEKNGYSRYENTLYFLKDFYKR